MPTITDKEFGEVTIRRSALSQKVKLKLGDDGKIVISIPKLAPLFLAKTLLAQSRGQLRAALTKNAQQNRTYYNDGDIIGKLHRLKIIDGNDLSCRSKGNELWLTAPQGICHQQLQAFVKPYVKKSMQRQAKIYLPPRIQNIAAQNNFFYERLRFSSATSRWGSCTSTKTISLNIWLMKLPDEIIDYVIVHELCHTVHMNHSADFWALVESIVPSYKLYRKILKQHQPRA